MQLRFWGGWFLAIAGLAIVLSMGCEKGALGVKPAIVTGYIVKADNGEAIPGATVRIMSKEGTVGETVKVGSNFMTTITDANGRFWFDNVVPDNIMVEYSKGSNKGTYPSATTSTTDTETGATSEGAQLEAVYVKSGAIVDLGSLPLTQIAGTLPSNITIKLDLVNATTLEKIPAGEKFVVTLNGVPLLNTANSNSLTAGELRDGISKASEQALDIVVRHDSDTILYQTTTPKHVVVNGSEIYETILLTPVSYNLFLRCVNVPDYITVSSALVNVFAEDSETNPSRPPQILATHTFPATTPVAGTLPSLITISALSMPVDLRIQVRGYQDEVLKIVRDNLTDGTQGNYRIDIDFLGNNSTLSSTYHPTTNNVVGIFDNMLRRDVALSIAGPDLSANSWVDAMINLPYLRISTPVTENFGLPRAYNSSDNWIASYPSFWSGGNVSPGTNGLSDTSAVIIFPGVAVGYALGYTVTVDPALGSAGYASGSFGISYPTVGTSELMVSPEIEPGAGTTLVFGVPAKRSTGT
ncbi:MAG: carboxypeptidase-like regulatory domain-containing protein [Candidatus Riflebacteria bacterium]|nr:carboxypeptidase-like regulatory domain-containing protein [Candidatus Riflebacteria bacterium]